MLFLFLNREAYEVACLGVTYKDWENLALVSLEGQQIEVARKAFARTREYRYLNLISQFEAKIFLGTI